MITGVTTSSDIDLQSTVLAGGSNFSIGTSTTTQNFTINSFGEETIEGFQFKETSDGNFIEVVKRQKPNPTYTLAAWPPREPSDRVFKEIYGITRGEDGKKTLKLLRTIDANVTPGHYVEESIEFPE